MEAPLVRACRIAGVRDERVLQAVAAVPRASFVPRELVDWADEDSPLPIPHDQVTTQPSLVALMIEALELSGTEKVLEIGTGYGWQTALLAHLAEEVWSIERFADIAETARENLRRNGTERTQVVVGDGTQGLAESAPFDAILVAAAHTRVPEPLVSQLADDGRLVMPIGPGGREIVVKFVKTRGQVIRARDVIPAHFVRLVGQHGFPTD
ncbi:MAG: protein-L-isoaspartate(D-aspartate) O-methyltransferase [Jiangellaceae bacterium]|nr:protein-L-isoaspartate(D-aspartate) O-methyltransferase [Jiangellaceae bacterium]